MKKDLLKDLYDLGIKNPYFLLEIPESASSVDIEKAFKARIKKYSENKKNADNQYLVQMLKTCRDVLLNEEARIAIDEAIQSERQAHALQPFCATPPQPTSSDNELRTEELLKSSNERVRKQARRECLLPEILEDFGIHNENELSFADLQLVLREYLKQGWNSYNLETTSEMRGMFDDVYILLDKKGQLHCVESMRTINFLGFNRRSLVDVLVWQTLDSSAEKYGEVSHDLLFWESRLPEDQCLVTLPTIFPLCVIENGKIKDENLIKGVALGNECLTQLKKTGYLKQTSPKEYIK